MTNKLLYFPYIDIPKSSWTIKSILYWDSVGIIVPPNFIDEPNHYEKFTLDLLQSDLIENIFPTNYINSDVFDENFIKLTTKANFELKKRQTNFKGNQILRIHFQKFGEKLLEYLVKIKLAKRDTSYWYYVESKTANQLMLYLALEISRIGKFTPATDSNTFYNITTPSIEQSILRQNLIDNLIPYPVEPNLFKLRKFKDKHYSELNSFRILIEQFVLDVSLVNSENTQNVKVKLKVAEINDKREKILSELNNSNAGKIAFGNIIGITSEFINYLYGDYPLGIFALTNELFSGLKNPDKTSLLKNDFSYLALIDKELK
jgi:hypothetical protein